MSKEGAPTPSVAVRGSKSHFIYTTGTQVSSVTKDRDKAAGFATNTSISGWSDQAKRGGML